MHKFVLAADDPMLDPRVFCRPGCAIIIWPHLNKPPFAWVHTDRGSAVTVLKAADPMLRPAIVSGSYRARWNNGYVTVEAFIHQNSLRP